MTAFEEYPQKNLETKFVVQAHFRKERSVHLDVRLQNTEKALVGYTIPNPFTVDAPFDTYANAKKIVVGEMDALRKRIDNPNYKFLAIPKAVQPIVWLTVQGLTEKGEVGSTRFGKGAFVIMDKGRVEFGRLSTYFREYWLYGAVFKGRFVARLIPGSTTSDPEDMDSEAKTAFVWLFWKTKEINPYVLTRRAINQEYIPPYNVPALPKEIIEQIPTKYRYWHHKNRDKRLNVRRELVDSKILKLEEEKDVFEEEGEFTLMLQSFKGQFVIRFGPSQTIYHLFLLPSGNEKFNHYVTISDPVRMKGSIAMLEYPKVKKILAKGYIAPGTYYNPTKDTDSFSEVISQGKYKMWRRGKEKIIELTSPRMAGKYILKHETPKSEILLLKKI